jgi:hypothetical protein
VPALQTLHGSMAVTASANALLSVTGEFAID